MSFCRITGRSRGLPKPNYFPLLPPISPADAKRFCRITGKSYGLPTHHYIPVLLGVHSDKSKCRITTASGGLEPHHYTAGLVLGERKKHVVLKDYRYVFPVLSGEGDQQKALRDLLSAKDPPAADEEGSKFVYTVEERRCSLVFPARLEAAVRDGDVRDVMLSRDCDTVLLRLKQGKNVSVDFRDLEDFEDMYDGLGPREEVVREREKQEAEARRRKRKRTAGLSYAKRIFEEKEKVADEEELRKAKQLRLRSIREESRLREEERLVGWKHVEMENARSRAGQLTRSSENWETVRNLTTSDWEDFGKVSGEPIVDRMPVGVLAEPETIDIEATAVGAVTSPISQETGGLEAICVVKPFAPLSVAPEAELQHALENMSTETLEETSEVGVKFSAAGKQALEVLPRIDEIPELVKCLGTGKKQELHRVKGLRVDIESAQRFLTGQTVETPTGPVFVPGQTLRTPTGNTFVPGFTVHTPDGPLLIPGQIVTVPEKNGERTPVFVAGQTLPTKSGQRFVQGQTIHTSEGARFVTGQTVLTEEGPKFVAGQVVTENSFVPGQTVLTQAGARFMPGQTVTDQHGEHVFVPGQSVQVGESWTFVPGQCLTSAAGESMFVPGRTLLTPEGPRFVAGQDVATKSGESHFVPGVTVDSGEGPTFVPGATLDTPQGPKFVPGQIVKTPEGEKFVPGKTLTSGGSESFEFAAARSVSEIVFMEATPVGIAVDPKTASAIPLLHQQEVYGHMVQTDDGVEFVPEWTKKFPEGKRIVPGQLVRGGKDGPRFVPGLMTEDGFLPGQIVMTEKGEQFVPGQVVDTSTGPKFVPGRMVETRTGTKFVPGQTVETEDGPRFVPGQIVQTKVGPTFIPGQVISTEDAGSRFVPGQVVDTQEGPRFVPGRVVESGEHGVTFVPGQIVQTEEGPRFVAPDLMDTPEGEMEFSVQGFEVTPEELGLLRPQHLQYNARSLQHQGETSIDARMLRQLSEAGMSIGRKVPADLPKVDVDVDPSAVALEHALVIAEQLGLRGNSAVQMAQIASTISQLANNIVRQQVHQQSGNVVTNGKTSPVMTNGNAQNGNAEVEVDWLKEAVKAAIAAAVLAITDGEDEIDKNGETNNQSYVLSSISEAFNVVLRRGSTSIDQSVSEVLKILLVPQNRTTLCQDAMLDLLESSNNKIDILRSTVVGQSLKSDVVLDRLSAVLNEEVGSDLVGAAFRNVSRGDPELVSRVLRRVSQDVAGVATEKEAAETLHKAIVHAVRESSELRVKELLNDEGSHVRELLLQAVGLARALGMSSTASSLLAVISDDESTQVLAGDKLTLDILKRLTVMRKLAEERPQFVSALRDLCSDPELARTDPRLRTLVRESAALMIVPEEAPLQSSVDVPTALLRAENSLAIEEFLMRRSHRASTIFMILKQGIQAVVPREASRAVLTGQVAYTVLDENGITHFEPLHVFSALRLNKPAAHRFSMYCCPVAGDEEYFDAEMTSTFTGGTVSVTSTASLDGSFNGHSANREREHNEEQTNGGVTLTRSDRSHEISTSPDNTPSFRKLSSLYLDSCCDRKSVENFIVVKDYVADDDDGFSVNVGDIVEAIDYLHDATKKQRMDPELEVGVVGERLDNSAARHKLSVRPRRKYADPRARLTRSNSDSDIHRALVRKIDGREGWLPVSILMQTALSEDSSTLTSQHRPEDSQYRREAVVKELVETEEEFGRDIQQVVERYLKPLDTPGVPRAVRDNKEIIFTNLKQIADFHNTVLIEGAKYYADQPRMLGKTFLRLERDFDKHVAYCRDEPAAQEFLQTNDEVREYFEELSQTLGDDKSVSEHLKLPIQRINDYQLLLKELVKYSTRLGENCDDLQKALELMLGIPHRATDNKFISNIEGYKGNIHKLGRLLTHEWFTFIEKDGKNKERYLFLFKARILVCKVRRISDDRSVFVLKDIIKLPEVEVKDHPEDLCTFELHHPAGAPGYPITLVAHKDPVKKYWLKEIREYASDQVALAEHAADDLQLTEVPETGEEVKGGPAKPEGTRVEPPKPAQAPQKPKAEPAKPEAPKAEAAKPEVPKPVAAKPEVPKAEPAKPEVPKPVAAKPEVPKVEPAKPEVPKVEPAKPEVPKVEPAKPEVAKPAAPKPEAATAKPAEAPKPTAAPPKPVETKTAEKRRESLTKIEDSAVKKIKTAEEEIEMSGSYSASRYSASTRVVEEYSSVSSSRNGVSSCVESSISTAAEKTSSSSYGSAVKISETSSSYQSAVGGSLSSADTKVEKLALTTTETGRPAFVKTIEGSTAEPIRAKQQIIHVIVGENATFECTLSSKTESTKMQWFKDNKPLTDKLADRVNVSSTENSFKLVIKNVIETDSGIYTARAANGDGKASCTAQLVVQNLTSEEKKARAEANAPIFLVSLKDTELLENTYLRFMIKVKGDPNPELKFFKDGVQIDSKNERVKIISEKAEGGFYELVISDVQRQDAGKYSCTATNRFGEVSCEATVSVTDEKTIFAGLPEGFLEAGMEPEFKWLRDGKPFDPEERFKVLFQDNEDTLALVFQHVKPEDAGLYTCVAQTNTGNISCSAELTVQGSVNQLMKEPAKPSLGSESKQSEVNAGGSAMLDLQVKGYPKPDIKWTKDGQEIIAGGRIKYLWEDEESVSLVIKNVTSQDAGTYTIRAKNDLGEDTTQIELIVKSAPKFTKKITDFSSYIEQSVSMNVQIQASPAPEVKWYKDGHLIEESSRVTMKKEGSDNYTLIIHEAKLEDTGSYSVVAKNELNQTSEFWKFDVKCPPKITKKLGEPRVINEGDTLDLQIEVETVPEPTVVWLKDKEVIVEDERIKIISDGAKHTLRITRTISTDAATYSAEVTNKDGKTVDETGIEVRSAPRFKTELSDVTAKEGDVDVAFAVEVAGYPRPKVQWYMGDVEITETRKEFTRVEEGDNYKLIIKEVKTELSGKYTCKLSNEYGANSSSSNLTVNCRPKIMKKLVDQKCKEGETLKLKVEISGTPDPDIKWLKDGEVLDVSADARIKITRDKQRKESYDLTLNLLKGSDGGVYEVKAENEMGSISCKSKVIVLTEPPTFVQGLVDGSVRCDLEIEFRVEAAGIARPKLRWLLNGDEIQIDERHTIETKVEDHVFSCLKISKFAGSDEGQLTCVATNLAGKVTTSCNVSMIRLSPTFESHLPRSAQVDEGQPLELSAQVDGSPFPTVAWYKDGEQIVPDEHVKIEKLPNGLTKLTIDKVVPTDSGAYKLIAKNNNGENSALCAVAVKPLPRKPSFEKPLEDVHIVVGEPLKLEAQVVAFPSPELQWFKDGLPLRPSKEIEFINEPNGLMGLSIDEARPQDAGTYSLVASNKHGEVTGTANVAVEEKEKQPGFLATLQPITAVEGFPAKLEIKTTGNPQPTLKWTHNGEEVVPDGKHVKIVNQPDGTQALLIDKVRPEDAGDYEVVAENSQGSIASKGSLNVVPKGKTDGPEQKPSFLSPMRDASVEEGEPLVLSVPFAGNPLPDVSWTKDGQPLESSDRVMLTCDGKKLGLEINPSELKDAGTYACRLANPLGEDKTSGHAIVRKVFQKPHFTQRFTDLQQVLDFDAKFMARISGVPRPDIAWFFNDKPILRDSDKYKIKRDGDACCLYVRNCAKGDSGRYKCRAVNKDGEDECEAKLLVVDEIDRKQKVEPPSFLKKIGDCEVYKGMTAKFTACVTGNPEPAFEWYRNDERVWPTDRIRMEEEGSGLLRLIIQNVEEHDVGKYSLRIYNPHGEDVCHAEIRYETLELRTKKPLADQYEDYDKYRKSGIPLPLADRPIISRMMDRHLTLSWRPSIPIGPRVPVTYLVEMCELPDGDWFTARSGIRNCVCDIRNLQPFRDYKFRIRVENKYGISEPSPYAQTYRAKLEPDPPKFHPYLPPGIDFRPETSPYFPKDFDIERPPHDGYAQPPRFLRQEFDTQYGVKNHNCNLFWFVYGYPKPRMTYYFDNELIESGGRYDQSYTRNGQATLFINKMLERDVGMYEAVATNEHGEARQRVRLQIAEYPTFIQRPDETVIMMRRNGQIQARVIGIPYPELKWYKDWKPITETSRIKIVSVEPDVSILIINDAIMKDTGLYSLSARNVAGSVSSSAMVHIEDNEHNYGYRTYTRLVDVRTRDKPFDDFYDLGDELGRGTQGITYHAVERTTGNTWAAKVMHGRGEVRPFMFNEMTAMNHLSHRKLLRLHDAYETGRSLTLVTELAGGGELVDNLTKLPHYTEYEIAGYIRQVLYGLEYIHDNSWAHLGLTLGDLLISHPGGDDLKIGDFGLARRIAYGRLMTLVYGMPEYVAPEVANGEGVSYAADMWSLGIITYILLSGVSPFRGVNDRETLTKIKEGHWEFDESWWCNISLDGRDFIRRLLCYTAEERLDVVRALRHPWLNIVDKPPLDPFKIPSENLKNYYKLYRDWYSNASCRTWYRRRRLSGAFEHPSKMVYPPGQKYTPEPSPERSFSPTKKPTTRTWENRVPSREPIDTEIGMFSNESHYQNGPDTYLLQLRDTDFPVRLREYMKVANNRGAGFARTITDDNSYDWRTPIIRERRRFTDVMDEEIDDERKARINNYGAADCHSIRRLRHELGTRLDSYAEAEAMMETKKGGHLPFFREKPQILPIEAGKCAQLCCLAVGNPKPAIQWFKNDLVIQEGNRIRIIEDTEGRSMLSFNPARDHDVGIYKVVARNRIGQTVARTRVVLATVPGMPNAPEVGGVSDTEVLLRWKPPKDDGNSEVLCYNLQYKVGDSVDWIDVASNIDHEFYLIRDLSPETSYNFRLAVRNRIGWSEKGILTNLVQTKPSGAPKLQITRAMRHLQALTESGQEIVLEEDKPHIDYSVEDQPLEWTIDTHFTERYSFISEVCKGQFCRVVKGCEKLTDKMVVAKLLDVRQELQEQVGREFQALRSLRHERIAILEAAYWAADSPVAVLILEKLQGADVLTYLASRHEYTENCVATIVTQVLDGLQYLHWRGYCHLDIQPDNVVMASVRSAHVKIVDMGSALKVSKLGTEIPKIGHHEYRSPEVENEELCYPQTDIWSVAVLAYVLLSGASPFRGKDPNETRQNISFVRYRFEYLYKEISQEATRFLMLLFKRTPSKRPTAEECHEHRWLLPTEFMIRKRERAIFPGSRLKNYNEEYHQEKAKLASTNDSLAEAFGTLRQLNRSNSIQDELETSYDVVE